MNVRRVLSLAMSAAVVVGLGVAAAPTVAAAANPSVVTINYDANANRCFVSATSVRANVGDVVTVHNAGPRVAVVVDGRNPTFIDSLTSVGISFNTLGPHTIAVGVAVCPTTTVNVVAEPVAGPTRGDHDDLQQVGVPASGDCADVPDTVGHYPGAPFGGWSKSWAMWINGGKGGPVCTRELDELSDGTIVLVG